METTLILPTYNRCAITLRCLEHLRATGVFGWAGVVMVDDGSTDGTAAAVRADFPEVTVLTGDGNLFWSGAIALGMRHAMQEGSACCVWLNDDSHPVPGAVERIVRRALADDSIVSGLGRFVGRDGTAAPLTFHALRKSRWGLSPRPPASRPDPEELIPVDACRGNLVAVPRKIIDAIGYPDAVNLPQYFGDTDYTLRATGAGFRCWVDPIAVVEEKEFSGNWDESWLTTRRPLRQIWARFGLKPASMYWRARWVYYRRHWGFPRGSLLFASPYLRLALISLVRCLVPVRWISRLRQR